MDKLFGLPVRLTAGGMSCDLIDAEMTEQSSNDQTKHIQANQQLGIIGSALEHQVLEQLFSQNGEQGFSAVKAIQLANEQGQKIYTITQENYQEIIPKLQLAPAAIADIRAAAQAGLTVTTHEKRIHVNGYTGEGYIILNERGTGAYMINGGMYGGILAAAQQLYLGIAISTTNLDYFDRVLLVNKLAKDISKYIRALGRISIFASIASGLLDLVDIYARCGAIDMFLGLEVLGLMLISITSLLLFAGPLSIISISLALSYATGKLKEKYFNEHNECK